MADQRSPKRVGNIFNRFKSLIKSKTSPGVHSVISMKAAGFEYTGKADAARCKDCRLEISNWTKDMDPWTIHSKQKPDCSYIKSILQNSSKHIEIEPRDSISLSNSFMEITLLLQLRRNTFSHWPHRTSPSSAQMIEAGFFNCNVGDRVICIYCNLICQQWTPHIDDPCEVHKTLSPHCPYVKSKLIHPVASSHVIVNKDSPSAASTNRLSTPNNLDPLKNWGPNDNPTRKRPKLFRQYAYAKQLYDKMQEAKRAQQKRAKARNNRQLWIPDESTLSRLVDARLDLPISQRLLDQHFKLSIIKRCWEDQLRLKQDDFPSDCDLYIACLILQKQIVHIDGKKENIVIPSIKMKQIREQNEALLHGRTTDNLSEAKIIDPIISPSNDQDQLTSTEPSNPCILCQTEEKRLACIPCGHLATCVPCGYSLQSCPVCRRKIEAFVRIYI